MFSLYLFVFIIFLNFQTNKTSPLKTKPESGYPKNVITMIPNPLEAFKNLNVTFVCCVLNSTSCPIWGKWTWCVERKRRDSYSKSVVTNLVNDNFDRPSPSKRGATIPNSSAFYQFCCECQLNSIKCPICYEKDVHACSLTYNVEWISRFYTYHFKPMYETLNPQTTYTDISVFPDTGFYLPSLDGANSFFDYISPQYVSCTDNFVESTSMYSFSQPQPPCIIAQYSNKPSPCNDEGLYPSGCDYSISKSYNTDNTKICSTDVKRSLSLLTLVGSPVYFCGRHYMYLPTIGDYFSYGVKYDDRYSLNFIGSNSEYVYFRGQDFKSTERLLEDWSRSGMGHGVKYENRRTWYVINPSGLRDEFIVPGSWFGNIYITKDYDCELLPYDNDKSICRFAYEEDIFMPWEKVFHTPLPILNYDIQIEKLSLLVNMTCNRLSNLVNCSFYPLIDEFSNRFNNSFYRYMDYNHNKFNDTFFTLIDYFINGLGKNDSNVYYYVKTSDGLGTSLVGNWLSGIFGVLIQPFFDVFVETIKLLLNESLELFNVWVKVFVSFIEELLSTLSDFVTAVINLLLSLIVLLESKFLLFEYTALFLFLMLKINKNVYFCLTVVLIFIIVFGLNRKSPSLVLFFINPEFNFNLTEYFDKDFTYDYSIGYTQNGYRLVYNFKTGSVDTYINF